jgi:hypothetical protein
MQLDIENKISKLKKPCSGCSDKFCNNFLKNPFSGETYCDFLSKRIGQEFKIPIQLCHEHCIKKGPYNNKAITENEEKEFVINSIKKYNSDFINSINQISKDYDIIYDIKIPEFYDKIKKELHFLKNYKGFKKFTLTGPCLTIDGADRIDIILWFESLEDWLSQNINKNLPRLIENKKINFFIYTGRIEETSSMIVFQLDIEDKILYTSKWFDLKLLKIPDDFKIKYSKCEYYNFEFKKTSIENIIKNESYQNDDSIKIENSLNQNNTQQKKYKFGWKSVAESWGKASQFLNAVNSRGIISTALDYANIDNSGGERVSDDIYKMRYESCFGNETNNIPACIFLSKDPDDMFFCGGCGCGSNKLAILTSKEKNGYSKLHYPHLECPLAKPGFSNHI